MEGSPLLSALLCLLMNRQALYMWKGNLLSLCSQHLDRKKKKKTEIDFFFSYRKLTDIPEFSPKTRQATATAIFWSQSLSLRQGGQLSVECYSYMQK